MDSRLGLCVALVLVGCGSTGRRDQTQQRRPSPPVTAPGTASKQPNEAATSSPAPGLTGKFEAYSETAMAITGDLILTPGNFKFQLDQEYKVGPPSSIDPRTAYSKTGDSLADLLMIPANAKVTLWRVTNQRVGKGARPNGGLCSGDAVRYIVAARNEDDKLLELAAFAGKDAPRPAGDERALCGTYNYSLPAHGHEK